MARRSSERRASILTWVLFAVVGLAAVILAVVTYRTTFQLEALRTQAVFEATLRLCDEKVDRVDRAIIEADDSIMALAEGSRPDDIPRRWRTLLARRTPTVARVVVLDANREHELVAFSSRSPSPDDDAFRVQLLGRVLGELSLSTLPVGELKHLHKSFDGQFLLLAYWRTMQLRPDGTSVERILVVHHDTRAVASQLLEQVVRDPRASTAGVNVVDDEGRVIYGPPLSKSDLLVARRFPTTLYAWRLQAAPIAARELVENARRNRLLEMVLLGLSCFVVVAGVVVLLLATAQEQRLNRARGDFVANVSHELKTPLSLVRMFAELLGTGRVASEEKRAQYLAIVVRESERLSALIENVLDFARVERGQAGFDFSPGDLGAVVHRSVEACRYRAETEGMNLEVHVEAGLPAVRMDERAVQLVIINLVENALKYAQGTGVVRVEVAADERIGGRAAVALRVIDEGLGIEPEEHDRIFERFYRGKRAREGQVRGSGIGLALVRHIAEGHGGDATVCRSSHGAFSTFVVRLPVDGPRR